MSHFPRHLVCLPLTVFLCCLLAGCRREAPEQGREAKRRHQVAVQEVGTATFYDVVSAIGTLEAIRKAHIRPELDALVTKVVFEEGQTVGAEQPLFILDDSKLQEEIAQARKALQAAEARLELAQKEFERADKLLERGAVAKDVWDQARADLDAAKADVKRLSASLARTRKRLEDTRITAPFKGVMSETMVHKGDLALVGNRLATIYDTSQLEVALYVPERRAADVGKGQAIQATVEAYPGRSFDGTVSFVSPNVEPRTRRLLVKATLQNPEGALKPGMFARIRVILAERKDRPAIPERALVPTRTGFVVFTVTDGKAEERAVEPGVRKERMVEVRKGLTAGDKVVVSGYMELRDGDEVSVTGEKEAEGG